MAKIVLGVFSDRLEAEDAIASLEKRDYNPKDLSIIMKDHEKAESLASDTGVDVANSAVTGATTGGLLGALAGLLIGIGAITIPGVGVLLIGGPIALALGLTGAAATTVAGAATGILAGGLIGALVGLGVPEEDARFYETSIKEGGILVIVPARAGDEDEVIGVLRKFGASQVRSINDTTYSDKYTKRDLRDKNYTHRPAYFSEVKRDRAAEEDDEL